MKDTALQIVLDTNEWNFEQSQDDKDAKAIKAAYRHEKIHGAVADDTPEDEDHDIDEL